MHKKKTLNKYDIRYVYDLIATKNATISQISKTRNFSIISRSSSNEYLFCSYPREEELNGSKNYLFTMYQYDYLYKYKYHFQYALKDFLFAY